MVTSLFVALVAVSLVVAAVQLSCLFGYQEAKKGEVSTEIPNGCPEQ